MRFSKIFNFLLFGSAISSRNLTSLALVALFFGVYVAAGGKISSVPKVKSGDNFGSVESSDEFTQAITEVTEVEDEKLQSDEDIVSPEEESEDATEVGKYSLRPKNERQANKKKLSPDESNDSLYPEDDISPEDSLADIERRLRLRK